MKPQAVEINSVSYSDASLCREMQAGRIWFICYLINQSRILAFFWFVIRELGWIGFLVIHSCYSFITIDNKRMQVGVLQGFFTVLGKYRWMDSMDQEFLHGGEVVLHLLPTGTSYSPNSPKKKPIHSDIVGILWYRIDTCTCCFPS